MLVSTVVFCVVWTLRDRCGSTPSTARRRSSRPEGARRLGDLAARRRRAGLPRPRGGRLPARARARRRGGDHRRARRRHPRPTRCTGSAARCRRACATRPVVRLLARARARAPTSSTRPACSAAPRSAPSLARTPFVTKLTADPAYERARRWGLAHGSLEEFQQRPGRGDLPLRLARDADVRRAAHVVTPSTLPARARARLGRRARPGDAAARTRPRRCPSSPRARSCARRFGIERPDARLRGAADRPEVARARDRGGAPRPASTC